MATETTRRTTRFVVPADSEAPYGLDLLITPESAGWDHGGLAVLTLAPGEQRTWSTGAAETLVLPLSGSATVTCDGETIELTGRPDVFAGPTDFGYVPRDAEIRIASEAGGRFALPSARCERRLDFRYQPVDRVPVELRGAGQASRQVNNFCTPEAFEADALIACEVLTPGGNWSSYPPHKHDRTTETESELEEIYYFEVADGPAGPGMAYQRVYGSPGNDIDVLAEVRTGDAVLIPHGWHGPSMAAPGYDLYYLNVMAGPGDERAWRICDDPAHGWVRDTWATQGVDPRLPFGRDAKGEG
ncbi:5-deoxy-glucuronate isomerase [Nocardioides pocheonensis]|uniref:5-deoxy-glucuronate isomerase n=1 Tax=Nocardioides pocheonensis TaxID=661485 RepID=A0A3N0GX05_9ACTN|nr:5-deoxy-glucuronate isomerase [Nocardioides pocheonensis]RNM17004.1 5-deoxy-glucuronate isomerase [Nocardioides pocheonensis]